MTRSLDAIENAMTCLIAQVALRPIVDDYVESWKDCMERKQSLTDPDELIETVETHGIPILSTGPLWDYLGQCADDWRAPDSHRIIMCIVHGYAEENFRMGLCSCPARKPLIEGLTKLA